MNFPDNRQRRLPETVSQEVKQHLNRFNRRTVQASLIIGILGIPSERKQKLDKEK